MNDIDIKINIKKFFEKHQLMVLSTVDASGEMPKTESAVVAFAEKEDLSVIFGTSNKTRKYANLQHNQHVSCVIGWSREGTVQYEGVARELTDAEAQEHGQIMVLKNHQTEKFILRQDQKYFVITPSWIRLVDTSAESGGTYEINL